MGNGKQTTETQQQSQQVVRPTPTAQEQRILDQQEKEYMAGAAGREEASPLYSQTIAGLLKGGEGLPDVYNKLFGGIDDEMTRMMTQEAIADITPGFQKSGILDSGVAASIAGRTAGDIRRNVAENNLTRVFNLLQTGLGYGGQQQAASTGSLNQSLAGLRTITTTGSSSGMATQTSMNPFLKSFQTSLGSGLAGGLTGGLAGVGRIGAYNMLGGSGGSYADIFGTGK